MCAHFKSLPLRYIFQDPPLTPVQNFNYLYDQAKGDLIALLCDDDWWAPAHLEGAVDALTENTSAVARFSASLHVDSESATTGVIGRPPVLWLAAGRPDCCTTWCLAGPQVLAATWIMTPFHPSTLVARRAALRQILPTLKDAHIYQNDRLLQARLASLGTILYEPLVDTFVRVHPQALTTKLSPVERDEVFKECTETIWELSASLGCDLVSAWHKYLAAIDEATHEEVGRLFRIALDNKRLTAYGFEKFILPNLLMRILRGSMRLSKRIHNRVAREWSQVLPA